MLKNLIKKFIPKFLLSWYHLGLAYSANFFYGSPSEKIIVIGVTGTNGKSTTVNLISKIFEEAGYKTALSSTVNFKNGEKEWLNDLKMTMPGRFFLQKLLSDAVKAGCRFAIIECSSEGILQHRQIGIHFDAMVFTNLTPEHLEAHGGFENYKNSKLEYFKYLQQLPHKTIKGEYIPKGVVVNADDPHAPEFLNYQADKKITFSKTQATNIQAGPEGISFRYENLDFKLNLKGIFDLYNALAALGVAKGSDIDLMVAKRALEKISNVPGRMESIDEGQDFKVLVDYAPEPEGLKQLYASVKGWPHNKIIHLLGSTGGGRDTSRRKVLGLMAAESADYVIVTNEDPYNDDPQQIIDDVAEGAVEKGKILNQNLFKIMDRTEGIAKALNLAQKNDLVLLTGKGAEQKMAVKNGYIAWDDRQVAREELQKLLKN